jgi:hypothetical protein
MTAPPTPAQQTVHDAANRTNPSAADAKPADVEAPGTADAASNTTAAAAAAAGQTADGDGLVEENGVRVYRPKLHHTTFEEPTETLAR